MATSGLIGLAAGNAAAAPSAAPSAVSSVAAQSVPTVPDQSSGKYKENWSLAGGFFSGPLSALNPNASPAGSNVRGCKLTAANPRPVILVHALGVNQRLNWNATAPYLANRGFCVYSFTYGANSWLPTFGGLKPMAGSAQELSAFVAKVRRDTGAAEVDLVGHSQGTTISAYYIKVLGGEQYVKNLVGLAPNYRGSTFYGLTFLAANLPPILRSVLDSVCAACADYYPDSPFIQTLNTGGTPAVGSVQYTNIQPRLEQVVLPNSSGQIHAPNSTNWRTSDGCAADLSDHISIATSKRAHAIMLNALRPEAPIELPCSFNPPFLS